MENYQQLLEKFKIPIALSFLGLVLIIGGIFTSGLAKNTPKQFPKESLVSEKTISVDVSGAVIAPGVYQLKEASRIEDAVKEAGGFSSDANTEFVSKYLNMAQKLADGSKVYVPKIGEKDTDLAVAKGVAGVNSQSVNINLAPQAELEALSGIGPVTASKIISGRPYQQKEELLDKKIVNKAVFEKIKDQIVVY